MNSKYFDYKYDYCPGRNLTAINGEPTSTEKVANMLGCPPKGLLICNGAGHAISTIFAAFLHNTIVVTAPATISADLIKYVSAFGATLEEIATESPATTYSPDIFLNLSGDKDILYLCNPDHLLGTTYRPNDIDELCKYYDLVIVNEEMICYCPHLSSAELAQKNKNLLIIGSMTYFGGQIDAPFGWIMGRAEIIQKMAAYHDEGQVSIFARRLALTVIENAKFYKNICARIAEDREALGRELESANISCIVPSACFLFAYTAEYSAAVCKSLAKSGFTGISVEFGQWLRIQISPENCCILDYLPPMPIKPPICIFAANCQYRRDLLRVFRKTAKILDIIGVTHWLCGRSLVGYARYGKLNPWDFSAEIAIAMDHSNRLEEASGLFAEEGCILTRTAIGNFWRVNLRNIAEPFVDIYPYLLDNDQVWKSAAMGQTSKNPEIFENEISYDMYRLFPLETVCIEGVIIKIPGSNIEEILKNCIDKNRINIKHGEKKYTYSRKKTQQDILLVSHRYRRTSKLHRESLY